VINNTVGELARLIGADPVVDGAPAEPGLLEAQVSELVYDSRDAGPGSLFVALPGERTDGHAFAAAAWRAGAVAAITTRPVDGGLCLVTGDPVAAMGLIGRQVTAAAKTAGLRVIGITGSAGKSTTKDLLAQILEQVAPVVAPRGSMNNEIGLPTTASWVTAATRFLIAEMGAKGVGHIRYLCSITPPDIAVVLNVGAAHLGNPPSHDAIAEAKGELIEAVPDDGRAVLNAGDPRVRAMASRTSAPVISFVVEGDDPAGPTAEVSASGLRSDHLDRWSFDLHLAGRRHPVSLRLLGRHQVSNAVAAAAAAFAAGVPGDVIADALSRADSRSHWRMEFHDLPGGGVLINDAYNANPVSMTAALDSLATIGRHRKAADPAVSTIAVLGEMLELGDDSVRLHEEVGADVVRHGIDRLITVGAGAEPIGAGAAAAGMDSTAVQHVPDTADALRRLAGRRPGDLVLIKASRDVGLETIGDRLLAVADEVDRSSGDTISNPTGSRN
jgi:UDP-N-acetylmuramoyl-tripeptide--D-alanyl-D-alanine ligase